MLRLPLPADLVTRDGTATQDAQQLNSFVDDGYVYKRPGNVSGVTVPAGIAQGGIAVYPENPILDPFVFVIVGDVFTIITMQDVTLNPVTIQGVSSTAYIDAQQQLGYYDGMFLKWTATGRTMYDFLAVSPINPYTQDGTSAHIPNTVPPATDTFGFTGTAESALIDAGLLNCIPDNSTTPLALSLGYLGYSPLGLGVAQLGLSDSYLTEFVATQLAEWNYFTQIQTANLAAINAVTNYVAPTVQGGTAYFSSAAAQTVIDGLVAAGGGTGNTYTVSDILLGSFLDGAGTVTGPTISGVGTNSATMSLSKAFLGGYDVKRMVSRTYSIRSVAVPNVYTVDVRYATYITGYPALNTDIPTGVTTGTGIQGAVVSVVGYAEARARFTPPPVLGGDANVAPYFGVRYDTPVITSIGVEYSYYYLGVLQATGAQIIDLFGNRQVTQTFHYVDYVDTTSLVITANAGLSLTSTSTASQTNLTWGMFSPVFVTQTSTSL